MDNPLKSCNDQNNNVVTKIIMNTIPNMKFILNTVYSSLHIPLRIINCEDCLHIIVA